MLMQEQTYLGRCVIVLKRTCGDLAETTEDEMSDFLTLVRKLENLCRKTFGATMFNWTCLMNNAYQVSPPDPQVHWHFRARYDKSVEVAGKIFTDPNFGHHYLREENDAPVSKKILAGIFAELQKNL